MSQPDNPDRPHGDDALSLDRSRARPGEPLGDLGAAIIPGFGRQRARGASADFSNVHGTVAGTEAPASGADFSNVRSGISSTEASAGERQYTVQAGDTLSHIAQAQYGRASRWTHIYQANRDRIDDPDRIRPGQVLRIPSDDAGD